MRAVRGRLGGRNRDGNRGAGIQSAPRRATNARRGGSIHRSVLSRRAHRALAVCSESAPVWGPWFQTLTGHAVDGDVRHQASSGGALSALLIHALATGVVDRVLHVVADPERPYQEPYGVVTQS